MFCAGASGLNHEDVGLFARPCRVIRADPGGELWFYDQNRQYRLDTELTGAQATHVRDFLAFYREHPDDCRLATLSPDREPRPWQGPTMLLEENIVRSLYPAGRNAGKGLTAFQKNNRAKSVYRGMELLLRYRKANAADVPAYCPVLFDRCADSRSNTSSAAGQQIVGDSVRMLSIEVLDLSANIPQGKRTGAVWQALNQKLQGILVHEGKRAKANFEILERFEWTNAFQEKLDQLHTTEHFDLVEQWLDVPPHPVNPEWLSKFVHFRGFDPEKLALIASKCLIYKAPAGTRLFEVGMHDSWNFYLLDGTVALATEGLAISVVEGGTDKSVAPISFLKPRKYTVTTITEVSFIWVHDMLLQSLMQNSTTPPSAPSSHRTQAGG